MLIECIGHNHHIIVKKSNVLENDFHVQHVQLNLKQCNKYSSGDRLWSNYRDSVTQ